MSACILPDLFSKSLDAEVQKGNQNVNDNNNNSSNDGKGNSKVDYNKGNGEAFQQHPAQTLDKTLVI
ncbi:hypothetical protein CON22_24985 [Bacillus cereus]|nr:hypothetical protein CON22_24985 [Bacillus cereus]